MSKTIFLSFLGTNNYLECIYQFPNNQSVQTKYTQVAVVKRHLNEINDFLFFLTDDARKLNWLGENKLSSELTKLNIDITKIKTIDIPNGFNNNQLLNIFDLINSNIPENSHLIIDVTHSFRSLPITLSSVLEYLKKVKNVNIQHIYYGAFEVLGNPRDLQEKPVEKRVAPMLDITYLSAIQDWTTAIDHFLKFGNISKLKQLSDTTIKPVLIQSKGQNQFASKIRNIVNTLNDLLTSIYTCRSKSIIEICLKNSNNKNKIDTLIEDLEFILNNNYLLPQLNEPLEKIKEKIISINDNNPLISSVKIVEWCIDFNWIQQGYTLLQENLCSYIIKLFNRDYTEKDERENLSKALNIIHKNIPEDEWKTENKELIMFYADQNDKLKELAELYSSLSDFRNDINHAGYRQNSKKSADIAKKLDSYYKKVLEEIKKFNNHANQPI